MLLSPRRNEARKRGPGSAGTGRAHRARDSSTLPRDAQSHAHDQPTHQAASATFAPNRPDKTAKINQINGEKALVACRHRFSEANTGSLQQPPSEQTWVLLCDCFHFQN